MRESTGWSKAALALAAALLAVNVYRAATQSITIDEAFTYNQFVARSAAEAIRSYDANNHVLNTVLIAVSTALFGASELTVRLPSLLGGALYLFAAWRLCGQAFGGSWYMLPAFATLGLNPFVLDYLSAARGYGMGLGFLLLALSCLVAAPSRARLTAAGVALGLAVASNLVFAVPAAALAAAFACLVLARERSRASAWELVDHLAIPAVVAAFVLMVLPLSRAGGENFYYGSGSLVEALYSLLHASFGTAGAREWFAAAAALVAALSGAAFVSALRKPGSRDAAGTLAALAGAAMAFSLAMLVAAHHLAGVPYPLDRTGIYWVPLFVLAGFALARRRAARVAVAAVAAVCLVQFALLFRVDRYGAWPSDAGTRRIAEVLRSRETGARRVRVTASWELAPSLNFYRTAMDLHWLEPVPPRPGGPPGRYRALTADDAAAAAGEGLRILYRDPVSGAVLAE